MFFGTGLALLMFYKLVTWKVEPRKDKGENKRIKELEAEIDRMNKEYNEYRQSVEKVVGGLLPSKKEDNKKKK